MISIKFLGHACFLIEGNGSSLLLDPFLTGNPLAAAKPEELHPDLIIVSHGHSDHLGDAVEISKRTKAPVLAVP